MAGSLKEDKRPNTQKISKQMTIYTHTHRKEKKRIRRREKSSNHIQAANHKLKDRERI